MLTNLTKRCASRYLRAPACNQSPHAALPPRDVAHRFWSRCDGASAVEFALVAPVFIALLFGMAIYGKVLANYIAVQQLASEAARATVAGLNNSERTTLATSFVTNNVGSYPLLNRDYLSVATTPRSSAFQVLITYNMANDPMLNLIGSIPLPGTTLVGSAAVQNGGY
jgi:Flp pilus assembly protein TadG